MKRNFRKELIESLITLVLGLSGVVVATVLIILARNTFPPKQEVEQLERIESNMKEIQKIIAPYEYKDKLSKMLVVENFENTTFNQKPTNFVNKNFLVKGNFSEGFLYVKVSINGEPITSKGTVYVKLSALIDSQYYELGGHLIEARSLGTPKSSNYTELLYQLSDIQYKKQYWQTDIEVLSADWLRLFNESVKQELISFTSTVDRGLIQELSIYYNCVNGSSCSIKEI